MPIACDLLNKSPGISVLAIGPAAAAGGHSVGSGYWYGVRQVTMANNRFYLPLVLKNF